MMLIQEVYFEREVFFNQSVIIDVTRVNALSANSKSVALKA